MRRDRRVTRRSVLMGAGGVAAAGVLGGPAIQIANAQCAGSTSTPLREQAASRGIVYGASTTTWQIEPDADYSALFAREAGILFTEDDLLWWRLKPTPDAPLDFSYADRIIAYAEANNQHVFAAHLAWDEGFGEGWTDDDLWGMTEQEARDTLFPTIQAMVSRYQGRIKTWLVANEVTDPQDGDANGLRTNVPWYATIGPSYVAEAFHLAQAEDPNALLLINEFGFETGRSPSEPVNRRAAYVQAIDYLLDQGVPVQGVGIQAHLEAKRFASKFKPAEYRAFLADIAARGLPIMITEMDVLDDGLRGSEIDPGVADVYARFLDVALDEPAVKVVMNFGLSDRYSWLEEDRPRTDGTPRRPLPFDDALQPKLAYDAISNALLNAPVRTPIW
ncbi:endo-1,4-beta-xylanase [Phytoactinopolyspora halotolerans]|uniref:endo-1,4-beta-xylanase n=1 Tax=Phytoactinopolyspora halotolerans TaxID=1981512 RepID=A0A6L9S2J4_9ACTN|nr:endo-1,4-beta-xylanase [Phytoactinopolyspora halotolerans]NED99435.1 endo-1,4-beta-xylanase [Phytoactinopolyspora halotolerans]